MAPVRGFFGKLPARGDFVSAGLPRDFVSRWDAWLCGVLPAALEAAGDSWLQAPVWRFRLAPGVCGGDKAAGWLLPSVDRVGRRFPLTLAWLGDGPDDAASAAALALGRRAVTDALPPDVLGENLAGLTAVAREDRFADVTSGSLWQETSSGLRLLVLPALPLAELFADMMTGDGA
jgi:type VI secretion system protein ImpM